MPQMRAQIRSGGRTFGGIVGYPLDRLHEEVAFLAYHFHWDYATILQLEHRDRQRWCSEVSKINQKINEDSGIGLQQKSILDVV